DNNGPSYTYTSAGRLKTRTWARGATTTYGYDPAGALNSIVYSDATGTPTVTTSYDRLGRRLSVAQGTNTTDFTYNDAGQILTETYSAGVLASWQVNNVYDVLNRRLTNNVNYSGAPKWWTISSYDPASRLSSITDGTNNATYAYLTNSSLVTSIVMKSNTNVRLTIAKG